MSKYDLKTAGRFFLVLLIVLGMTSLTPKKSTDSENLSVLVLKIKYNSMGLYGLGGKLKIRNIDTNELFENYPNKGINPFVVIENLPKGRYIVEELKIISGPNVLTIRDNTKFNLIEINEAKVLYLGSYMTKKIKPLVGLNFQVVKKENDTKEDVYQQVGKKSNKWLNFKVDFEQSLFKEEQTKIKM